MSVFRYELSIYFASEKLLVECDPSKYFFINQGCLTVDGMDDPFEMKATDVSGWKQKIFSNKSSRFI